MRLTCLVFIIVQAPLLLCAQQGYGLRIGGGFHSFYRGSNYPVVQGSFSTLTLGLYKQQYKRTGGYQVGLNLVAKAAEGGFNLPVIMRDFRAGQNTSMLAAELDLRVGPRFDWLYPQIGAIVGYRWQAGGIITDTALQPNTWYASLPLGLLVQLPTSFGTVGVGVHYKIGLTNFIRNPNPAQNGWDGANLHTFAVEMHLLLRQR